MKVGVIPSSMNGDELKRDWMVRWTLKPNSPEGWRRDHFTHRRETRGMLSWQDHG